jgi:hypothetical protein
MYSQFSFLSGSPMVMLRHGDGYECPGTNGHEARPVPYPVPCSDSHCSSWMTHWAWNEGVGVMLSVPFSLQCPLFISWVPINLLSCCPSRHVPVDSLL